MSTGVGFWEGWVRGRKISKEDLCAPLGMGLEREEGRDGNFFLIQIWT